MSKIVANLWRSRQENPEQCTDRTERIVTTFMPLAGSFTFTSFVVSVPIGLEDGNSVISW